jgi:hypothetical protein
MTYTKLIERLNKIPVSATDWKTVEETVAAIDALTLRAGNGYSAKIEALIAERDALQAENERLTMRLKLTSDTMNSYNMQRAALSEQLDAMGKGEAVAYIQTQKGGEVELVWDKDEELEGELYAYSPLYAAPKALAPLTDEQIDEIWLRISDEYDRTCEGYESHNFARAIEAAHGIHAAKGGQQ